MHWSYIFLALTHRFEMRAWKSNHIPYIVCYVIAHPCFNFRCSIINLAFNTLRPRQNGHRFADDTFKRIFLNENVRILIKISLKYVPKGPINNIPALVQIMAWRRSGDKPLSEPMIVSLLTHIRVTWPQWVKSWHGSVIASHNYVWMKTFIHAQTNAGLTHWGWEKMANFSEDIFKYIFLNENVWIAIRISLKFVPECPIHNIPSLVQKMTWCHYLNQWWLVYRCMCASFVLNELTGFHL